MKKVVSGFMCMLFMMAFTFCTLGSQNPPGKTQIKTEQISKVEIAKEQATYEMVSFEKFAMNFDHITPSCPKPSEIKLFYSVATTSAIASAPGNTSYCRNKSPSNLRQTEGKTCSTV